MAKNNGRSTRAARAGKLIAGLKKHFTDVNSKLTLLNAALMRALTAFIRVSFGNATDVLADFGMAPPKARTPMTAEQKAVAVERRKATRAARGTRGPKAKQQVKGNVTVSLTVTPVAPAAAEGAQQPPAQNATPK